MLTLFSAATANGQKAAIALEEAGLEYDCRMLDLGAGEHLDTAILALNPVGRIPFLETDHDDAPGVIYGTLPIAVFAAETSATLLPASGPDRYIVLQWAAFAATDASHTFANQFLLEELLQTADRKIIGFVHEQAHRMLHIMDQRLQQSPFLGGEFYSIADILAYPIAATSAMRLPERLDAYPAIEKWVERVGSRPAVARGMRQR